MTDTDVNAAAPAEAAEPKKSEGQALLERMLAQVNRYNTIRRRLDQARCGIAPVSNPGTIGTDHGAGSSSKARSFFEGLKLLADANDQVANELEKSVEDLAGLF